MNLTDLHYVVEIEKSGSISKAAKELYVAQPNLSKAIKHLEREFGISIFERSSKGVKATRRRTEISGVCQKDHLRDRGNEKGLQ